MAEEREAIVMDEAGFLNSPGSFNSTKLIVSDLYTVDQSIVVMCIIVIILIISFLMNGGVIVISYLGRCFEKNPNSVYVFYLAIGDLMKGISFLVSSAVIFVYTYIKDGRYVPYTACVLPRMVAKFAIDVSGYTLVLTSFVQYLAMVHPLVHTKWIKQTMFGHISVLIGWTLFAIESIFLHLYFGHSDDSGETQCSNDRLFGKHVYVVYVVEIVQFCFGCFLMIVLNTKIIQTIIRRTKRISPVGSTKVFFIPEKPRAESCAVKQTADLKNKKRSIGKRSKSSPKEVWTTREKIESPQPEKIQISSKTISKSTKLTMVSEMSNSDCSTPKTAFSSQSDSTTCNLSSSEISSCIGMSTKSVTNKLQPMFMGKAVPSTSGNIAESTATRSIPGASKADDQVTVLNSDGTTSSRINAPISEKETARTNLSFKTGGTKLPVSKVRSPNHWKPYLTLIMLVMSFIVFFGPYIVYTSVVILTSDTMEFSLEQRFNARKFSIVVVANTIVNPVIYAYRIQVYRKYITTLVQKTWRSGN